MLYNDLTATLGYAESPLFCEDGGESLIALSDRHWIRAARRAGVKGTYFFKTSPEPQSLRPAVHVAQADTEEKAREIHRTLWNQGVNPFLIVVLPGQVRVYTGFAYDPDKPQVGLVAAIADSTELFSVVADALSAFTAEAINRGDIWQRESEYLGADQRVDTTLLKNLESLGKTLRSNYALSLATSHALIGKFVYLSYLRARGILSDKWLKEEAQVEPTAVFTGEVFSASVTREAFRKLARAVETRFNGKLFPIAWGSHNAPKAESIRTVARIFSGEETTGQMHLSFTAYDFASIPVEFLSSIYEQFLHAESSEEAADHDSANQDNAANPEKGGAHYTPEPLAEYLVSEINAVKTLQLGMRILDPCCGSGIFLVVAFRRLVELECERQKRTSLNASELRTLLETSIYAVERNVTACQITSFSLILALLSYVEPPELHQRKTFKFPTLVGNNLFPEDFFDDKAAFWRKIVSPAGKGLKFDFVVGNPPWVELKQDDPNAQHVLAWSKLHTAKYGLARARTGEAFAWRVMECLSEGGAVGLILHAKTLTNDHLLGWRQKFFSGVQVHRMTNFANMKYIIFASARHPCVTLIYTQKPAALESLPVLHFGPFVANQYTAAGKSKKKKRAWAICYSESEVKAIPAVDVASGDAMTWKMALWGNNRDKITIQRLRRVFSTRLGLLADKRGWTLAIGLQLRKNKGTDKDPNEEVDKIKGLKVLNHRALVKSNGTLSIPAHLLQENLFGYFVRQGRLAGLALISGPRLFLWHDFAAYSDAPFIFRHDKVGLAGGSAEEMKAVAAIWNSSYVAYLLFFVTTAAWGFGYSVIDKGDAENLPFPDLLPAQEKSLSAAWEEAAALERQGGNLVDIKALLDRHVAAVLGIPSSVSLVVSEFFRVRFQLNEGKNPPFLRACPNDAEMMAYASRLRIELDGFLGGKARHQINVMYSSKGISVSITLTRQEKAIEPEIRSVKGDESSILDELLKSAESQSSQWVYVQRSVRLFSGDTIHVIKPPRRLEWTETQALLDADDIIAEVIERTRRDS